MRPLKLLFRILTVVLSVAVVILLLLIIFAGSIAEYFVEKYDVQYVGREINIHDLDVNVLSGTIDIYEMNLMEVNGTDVFVGTDKLEFKLRLWQAFKKHFHVKELILTGGEVHIHNDGDKWNFADLYQRFTTPADTTKKDSGKGVAYDWTVWELTLDTFSLDSCYLTYVNHNIGNEMLWDAISVRCSGASTTYADTEFELDMLGQDGGTVRVHSALNYEEMSYSSQVQINELHLKFLEPYLKDYMDITGMDGKLTTDLSGNGVLDVSSKWKGYVNIHDLLVTDSSQDSLVGWGSVRLQIDSINVYDRKFDLQTLAVDRAYLRFEMYNEGDNWSNAMKIGLDEVEIDSTTGEIVAIPGQEYFNVFVYIADMTSQMVSAYYKSDYRIDTIGVYNSTIFYADYTLREQAQFLLEDLSAVATNFDTRQDYVTFNLSSRVNKTGTFSGEWRFDPQDPLEMELDYEIRSFLMSYFSPYSFHHTAFPLYHGELLYEGSTSIHSREIDSKNHLYVEDIEVGKRVFDNPPYKIPVRLAVSLLRDVNGDIDMDIPISGNIDDPNFHIWKIVGQVLVNLLTKAVTAPYRLLANAFSVDEDDLKEMRWIYAQSRMLKDQEKTSKAVAKVLGAKPELALVYTPVNNREYEKNELAVYEAKKRFFLRDKDPDYTVTLDDSSTIFSVSNQDSVFIDFLKVNTTAEGLYSVTERSRMLIGEDTLGILAARAINNREEAFMHDLTAVHAIDPSRIIKLPIDSINPPPDTFNLVGPIYLFSFDMAPDTTAASQ